MTAKIEFANSHDLIDRYVAGSSLKQLAHEAGVGRPALTRFLRERHVPLRGRSDAERIKWARIKQSPEQVRRQCERAWEAARERDKHAALRPRIIEMYIGGLGSVVIARDLGIPASAVKDAVRAKGIARDRSEAARLRCARAQVVRGAGDRETLIHSPAVAVEIGRQGPRVNRAVLCEMREHVIGAGREIWRAVTQKRLTLHNLFRR